MTSLQFEDHTKRRASAVYLVYLFIILTLLWFIYTVYRVSCTGHFMAPDFIIQFVLLFLFVKQGFSRYIYRLTDTELVVEEHGILGHKTRCYSYDMMDGLCPYTKDILGPIKYRFTHRLSSSMDGRPPMELVYSVVLGKQLKHARLILKADETFWNALATKIPGKVGLMKEEIMIHTIIRKEGFKRGYTYEEYLPIFENRKEEL